MGDENEKAIIPLLDVNGEPHSDDTKGPKLRGGPAEREPATGASLREHMHQQVSLQTLVRLRNAIHTKMNIC